EIQLRRDEQIHEYSIRIVPVNAVIQLGVFFHARSGAAPEGLVFGAERLPSTRRERQIVLWCAGRGMDGPEAMVEQRAFVIVEITRVGCPAIKMARQLHHVIRAAAL